MRVTHPTTDQSHYCPLGKVMDSIQSEHLLSYLNRNHALNKHQFGFLPDRSTVTQLVYVVDTWLRALDNGEQTSTIFMDFQKAFDRVWHATLLHKLSTSVPVGVLPKSISWLSSFLTDRTIVVRVGSYLSSQNIISARVPPGSTWDRFCFWFLSMTCQTTFISPLNFTLMMHSCTTPLSEAPLHYLPEMHFKPLS